MRSIIFAAICAIAQIAISARIAKQAAKREIEKACANQR